ncbi:hypothetical protein CHARACLAT_003856 [Characodon lateralis]|uniref:Uncharacterized protein n=1 Tax=Characodon lateralis TaxID=208331 RepID=A0ABU7ETP5_9TELE|nr:hypothetical protein [Characodon lateralis]
MSFGGSGSWCQRPSPRQLSETWSVIQNLLSDLCKVGAGRCMNPAHLPLQSEPRWGRGEEEEEKEEKEEGDWWI